MSGIDVRNSQGNLCHINIYEFIAIIINLWIAIRQLALTGWKVAGGHRILSVADNTSALSWLRYASRTRRPPVRRLARFLLGFLSHPFPSLHVRVQGKHLEGIKNVGADFLSRFEKAPSWESAIAQCSDLKTLRTCRLPRELLWILSSLLTAERTEAWYEEKMTRLWTLEPPSFGTGATALRGSDTSISGS